VEEEAKGRPVNRSGKGRKSFGGVSGLRRANGRAQKNGRTFVGDTGIRPTGGGPSRLGSKTRRGFPDEVKIRNSERYIKNTKRKKRRRIRKVGAVGPP